MAIGTPVVRHQTRIGFSGALNTVGFSPTSSLTANTTAILVIGSAQDTNGGPLTGVTDSLSHTWTVDKTFGTGGNGVYFASAYMGANPVTTSDTITLARTNTSAANYDPFLLEVSGLATAAPGDQTAQASGSGTAYSVGPTGTLAQANEIAIAGFAQGVSGSPSQTPGGSWTGLGHDNVTTALYQIVAATTALTATQTSTSASWVGALVTYKAVAAASAATFSFGGGAAALKFISRKGRL